MTKLKDWMLSVTLFGGIILIALLVGALFGILDVFLRYYLCWYIWGPRITWTLFIVLVIYVACRVPWESPKEPE